MKSSGFVCLSLALCASLATAQVRQATPEDRSSMDLHEVPR